MNNEIFPDWVKHLFWIIFILLIVYVIISISYINKLKSNVNNIPQYDTTYNHIVLDSIQYNIIKKDTIIYNYRKEMKDEIIKANNINDTAAVQLFYKLLSE